MSLATVIQSTAAAQAAAGNWVAVAAAVNAAQVRVPNADLVTMRTVMARLSVDDARTVIGTLRTAANSDALVAEALDQLRGSGLDLSHDNARAMITALFPDPLRSAVMALGEKVLTVTAAECERAIGLAPVSTWTGAVVGHDQFNGMVRATVRYTSNDGRTRDEQPFGDDLTPTALADIIAARCASLQSADAAAAKF